MSAQLTYAGKVVSFGHCSPSFHREAPHRVHEDLHLLGVLGQIFEHLHPVSMFERWSTGAYRVLDLRPSPHRPWPKVHARHTLHGVRNVAAERVGHRSLPKAPIFLLSKDAEICERTPVVDTRREREDPLRRQFLRLFSDRYESDRRALALRLRQQYPQQNDPSLNGGQRQAAKLEIHAAYPSALPMAESLQMI
jgi:hypothetical protein